MPFVKIPARQNDEAIGFLTMTDEKIGMIHPSVDHPCQTWHFIATYISVSVAKVSVD